MKDRKIKISVADSHASTRWKPETLTFKEFVSRCKNSRQIKYSLNEFNALPGKTQRKLKDGECYVFGELKDGIRRENYLLTREGLTFDYDDITEDQLIQIYSSLDDSNIISYIHSTASYDGKNNKIRVIIPFAEPFKCDGSNDKFREIAQQAAQHLNLPLNYDHCSTEGTHLMYFPTHLEGIEPISIHNADGEYLNVCDLKKNHIQLELIKPSKAGPQDKEKTQKLQARPQNAAADNNAHVKIDHDEACEAVAEYTKSEGISLNDYQNYIAAQSTIIKSVLDNVISRETGEACVKILAGNNSEWEADNVRKFYKELKKPNIKTDYTFEQRFLFNRRKENPGAKFNLTASILTSLPDYHALENGQIRYLTTTKNIKVILDYLNISPYLDVILGKIIFDTPEGSSLLRLDPDPVKTIAVMIADFAIKNNFRGASIGNITERLEVIATSNRRNIPEEKLKEASERYPNASGEIDRLISCFVLQEDDDFYRVLIRKALIQVVAMILNNEGKYGAMGMLVLLGAQQIGKSYCVKLLCSYFGDEYFTQNIRLNPYGNTDKDTIIQATSCVIGEFAEFETNPKAMNQLKAFVTAQEDVFRRAYGRRDERKPRQAAYFATTNKDEFLSDNENRRFWVVPVKFIDTTQIRDAINHQKMWAEAYQNFLKDGLDAYMLNEAERVRIEENAKVRIFKSKEEQTLVDFLDWKSDPIHWQWRSASEICLSVGLDSNSSQRMGYALKNLGYGEDEEIFQRRRVSGMNEYRVPEAKKKWR